MVVLLIKYFNTEIIPQVCCVIPTEPEPLILETDGAQGWKYAQLYTLLCLEPVDFCFTVLLIQTRRTLRILYS